jgi:hypothetical protein
MERLYSIYARVLVGWCCILVIGSYRLATEILPEVRSDLVTSLLRLVVSAAVVGLVFRAGEWIIRTKLWRSNCLVRLVGWHVQDRIDFAGLWYGETLYKVREQAPRNAAPHEPFSTRHDVRICQDALKVSVEQTPGENFATWGSVAATIGADGILRFLYRVDYTERENFPAALYGYEWLAPRARTVEEDGKGLPILLHGGFGHCLGEAKPTYSGETIFIRKGTAGRLSVDQLPEAFCNGKLAAALQKGELS